MDSPEPRGAADRDRPFRSGDRVAGSALSGARPCTAICLEAPCPLHVLRAQLSGVDPLWTGGHQPSPPRIHYRAPTCRGRGSKFPNLQRPTPTFPLHLLPHHTTHYTTPTC